MNLLAHFSLTSDSEALLAGSFIADFLRGERAPNFPSDVYRGILHHRRIDAFTDSHPLVIRSKRRLWRRHRHYAAVIVDIFYDHLLAHNWHHYSSMTLEEFARRTYCSLAQFQSHFPARANKGFKRMHAGNWLVHYRRIEGVDRALQGLAQRSTFESEMARAGEDLRRDYRRFEEDFGAFFPLLQLYSRELIEGGELQG